MYTKSSHAICDFCGKKIALGESILRFNSAYGSVGVDGIVVGMETGLPKDVCKECGEKTISLIQNMAECIKKKTTERIGVDTVFGKLFAEVSGNPDYPGIVICVERDGDDGAYDHQIALAECTPDCPAAELHTLRLMVWGNDDIDDYTESHTFFEETAPEPPSAIWAKYLQYLRDWTNDHADAAHLGMAPACFYEWKNNEY